MNEIKKKIRNELSYFAKDSIMLKRNMPLCLKIKVFNEFVLLMDEFVYGVKTRTLTNQSVQIIQIIEVRMKI